MIMYYRVVKFEGEADFQWITMSQPPKKGDRTIEVILSSFEFSGRLIKIEVDGNGEPRNMPYCTYYTDKKEAAEVYKSVSRRCCQALQEKIDLMVDKSLRVGFLEEV